MKFFAKNFPEKLISSIPTSEVVAKKVKLKKHGKEFQGLCPFHNEKSPSFTVNDQKGFYHCFGCQEHGNIIDFVMKTDGLEFRDTVVHLADSFGIDIPWQESKPSPKNNKISRDFEILEQICQIYQQNLAEAIGSNARNYLKSRNFFGQTAEKFRLGYAQDSYDALNQKLTQKGYSEAELLRTGLIAKNKNGKLYDKFRNRVIFPILDYKNRVIAFGGRVLGDELPKYLNSAETDIFKKSQTLYNISNARKAIFHDKSVIITEGYADTIALSAGNINNVVAGLGTALSKDHITQLFRLTDRIILCFDGDSAGINAAKRASEIALPIINSGKTIDFAFLPQGLDPDEFIKKHGADALKEFFANKTINFSQALLDFAIIELKIDKKSTIKPEEKAKIESILTKKAELIQDPIIKKYFSQFFKDILFKIGKNNKFSPKNSKKFQKNQENLQNFTKINKNIPLTNKKSSQNDIFAQNIIALITKFPFLANYQDENYCIKEISFDNDNLTDLKDQILEKIEENRQKIEKNAKNLLLALENYNNKHYIISIQALIDGVFKSFDNLNEDEVNTKMRLLLLKHSLDQVSAQYKQALSKIDEIDTHQTAITDQKIRELFNCKNSLEKQITEIQTAD